ncbi:MAG: hypothetical protein ACOCVZ_08565, partial [Gemmatimonadota bacterium]
LGLVLAAMLLMAGGCQDLDVTNPNDPDRDRALAQPEDVETMLGGTWTTWWRRLVDLSAVYNTMPTVGDEMTATYANSASLELSSEPRPIFNNNPTADAHWLAHYPWRDFNEVLANSTDVLGVINDGLVLLTPGDDEGARVDNTERAVVYGTFLHGMSLGYLAMFYDRAYYVDETTDLEQGLPDLTPYADIRDSAVAKLEEAAAMASAAEDFVLPFNWMFMEGVDNARLAQIANSFAARVMVYSARTPEEREQVDWNKVITLVEAGIGTADALDAEGWHADDYGPEMSPSTVDGFFWYRVQNDGSFSAHADYKLIGPSDVSGNYQNWLAADVPDRIEFLITTPDRRITGEDGPTSDGKYFEYRENIQMTESRGRYHFSHYQWNRRDGDYRNGKAHVMTVSEMNLILAEAHYRLGDLERAAELINISRVGVGELPPVTADGVPQAADCVPRPQEDPAGPCGTLLDALHYERMIEGAALDAVRTYLDRRGFGSLPSGTFLHLPIPGRELESLNMPVYTFGGVGGEGAAP